MSQGNILSAVIRCRDTGLVGASSLLATKDFSPANQSRQSCLAMMTGIRSWIGCMIGLASVVIMLTVRRIVPSGAFQDSQSPAIAIGSSESSEK